MTVCTPLYPLHAVYAKRRYVVFTIESPEALARMLSSPDWPACTAFAIQGHPEYYFVNESQSDDPGRNRSFRTCGVLKKNCRGDDYRLLDAFSASSVEEFLSIIKKFIHGELEQDAPIAYHVLPKLESPEKHADCDSCRSPT